MTEAEQMLAAANIAQANGELAGRRLAEAVELLQRVLSGELRGGGPLRGTIDAFLASQQGEQPECGCCGQTGPCDADCDTRQHPEQADGAQPSPAPELKRREYPSQAGYPDAEFAAECAEITGWNAAVIQHEFIIAALRTERDALQAELSELEQQKPAFWYREDGDGGVEFTSEGDGLGWPLYAAPVAQAGQVPDGWTVERVQPEDGIGFIIRSPRHAGVVGGTAVWSDAENPAEQLLALMLNEVIHEAG